MLEKLADDELVSLIRPQRLLQVLRQLFMNSLLLLRTGNSLRDENVLKQPNPFINNKTVSYLPLTRMRT